MSQGRKQTLAQVIAVERPTKRKIDELITGLYHLGQRGDPFNGLSRLYTPKDDKGEQQPPEMKLVQTNVRLILKDVEKNIAELFDITATKDFANCQAKASVVIDGHELAKDVPAVLLIFMEKYITNIRTIVTKLPTLSPDEDWSHDEGSDVWKSKPKTTLSTQKVKDALVLHPGSDKHPAQAIAIDRDITVGAWETTKLSGAMQAKEKEKLLDRIDRLLMAVKMAREEANTVEAPSREVGRQMLTWLFAA